MDPFVDQALIVDAGALDRGGSDEAAGHVDLEGDVGAGFCHRVDDAFNLNPLPVLGAGQQVREGDRRGLAGNPGGSEDGDAGLIDDGGEVAGGAYAGDIDQGAGERGASGPDGIARDRGIDAAGAVTQEEGNAPLVQVAVEVGDDGLDVDGIAAAGLVRGEAVGLAQGGEGAQRLRLSARRRLVLSGRRLRPHGGRKGQKEKS